MSARVRIFVPTHRRPHLLRRALASLQAQTLRDWICDVHNDAPDDPAPRAIVAALADARIVLHDHAENQGAVATMRQAFAGGPEPFATLLEDDNWWEPYFLSRAVAALDAQPHAALVWANMRLWREESDGTWTDTDRTIWNGALDDETREFCWPELLQGFDALHSHGAMVFRPAAFEPLPAEVPLDIIEPIRERAARGPLLFIPEPLAHFAITRETARSRDRARWLQSKLLIGASFFFRVEIDDAMRHALWTTRRMLRPRDTGILFFLAIAGRDSRLLRGATISDWLRFLAGVVRHPLVAWRGLQFRRAYPELWSWLLAHPRETARRASATVLTKTIPPHRAPCPVAS